MLYVVNTDSIDHLPCRCGGGGGGGREGGHGASAVSHRAVTDGIMRSTGACIALGLCDCVLYSVSYRPGAKLH